MFLYPLPEWLHSPQTDLCIWLSDETESSAEHFPQDSKEHLDLSLQTDLIYILTQQQGPLAVGSASAAHGNHLEALQPSGSASASRASDLIVWGVAWTSGLLRAHQVTLPGMQGWGSRA